MLDSAAAPRDSGCRGSHVSLGHPDGWRIDQALIAEMRVLPDFRHPDNIRFGVAPLYTSFAEVWDEVLPPTPEAIWKDNLAQVVRALTGEFRE